MNKISPCLWFEDQAEEAARFYTTVFENAKVGTTTRYGKSGAEVSGRREGSVMTVSFELEDLHFEGLNGGPLFRFTPALSFFVSCASESEITQKWKQLSEGGNVRMPLEKYPWAEGYGWTADRFGVEWQLILAPRPRKIVPAFLFVDALFGKGEEALRHYQSIFPDSQVETLVRDEETKSIMHCAFTLDGQGFVLMEGQGKHGHTFNEATSLMVYCEDQQEVDHYWEKLLQGGSAQQCGWLKDAYGVSWQIVPRALTQLIADPAKSEKVMSAMLKMRKLDIAALERAGS